MSLSLTSEQHAAYDEQGYLVVRELFRPEEMTPWLDRLRELMHDPSARPAGMLVMRDVMVAKGAVQPATIEEQFAKVQDFHEDPVLWTYVEHPRMLEYVAQLIGPDIAAIHTMLINKPPGVDGRHPLHQDLLYFAFRPAEHITASWTALEPCTRDNGCLAVVPGSHRSELLPHGSPDWEYLNLGYFGAQDVGAHPDRVHLEMAPGDTVFFHPLLLHGSGRNRSKGCRRAISSHYASTHCRFVDGVPHFGERPFRLVHGVADPAGILGSES